MSVLLGCLKDSDNVREGALKFLPNFLQALQPSQRANYVEHFAFHWHSTEEEMWRKRQDKAKQLSDFARLVHSTSACHKHFAPIFFELCRDEVFEVR